MPYAISPHRFAYYDSYELTSGGPYDKKNMFNKKGSGLNKHNIKYI
jgi:hypothetical protein